MTDGARDPRAEAAEAAEALQMADRARRGGRLLAVLAPVSRPLVVWGMAWIGDGIALRVLPWWLALPVTGLLGLGAVLLTVLVRNRDVASPWADAAARSWWALLLVTAVVFAVLLHERVDLSVLVLVAGALWGLGLLLYGIVSRERALLGLGVIIVLLPVPLAFLLQGSSAIVVYGVVAGSAMLAVGLWNTMRRS